LGKIETAFAAIRIEGAPYRSCCRTQSIDNSGGAQTARAVFKFRARRLPEHPGIGVADGAWRGQVRPVALSDFPRTRLNDRWHRRSRGRALFNAPSGLLTV
jgi:hypothetical protein